VIGMTHDMALELAPFNICVNAILPGLIDTNIFDDFLPPGPERDALFAGMANNIIPLRRVGTPDDIGGAALFLASELSGYMTGDRMYVSGGVPLYYLPLPTEDQQA